MPTKEQEIIYTLVIGTLLFTTLVIFLVIGIIAFNNRKNIFQQNLFRLQSQFSQTLLQTQLEIQEQTFQHISREVHDNLSQTASLIKIHLNTLQFTDIEKAIEKVENTKDLVRQLIADLKTLSVSLNSDRIAQSGLASALVAEADRINKTGQFTASFTLEGISPTVDNDKAIILYRMVQEVLNNMLKHSQAKQINILLSATENLLTLAVSDDGVGFDIEERKKSGGAGLLNLQNRARLINAKLTMQSTPGNGSAVTIELPL